MSLLKPAENQTAYLKMGMYGFQGSGKTYTASHIAAELARLTAPKGKTPKVAFFDTEKGSDFMVNFFKKQKIQFDVAKSQSFKDLEIFLKESVDGDYQVAIIDSVSHVWNELMDSYQTKLKRSNGLLFQDWGKVKGAWKKQFADLFINSPIHIIVLARAGYDYNTSEDESGKMQLEKVGTKMKAEGEFGYESDVLIEMERIPNPGKKGGWINRAVILKDRTDTMNGKVLDYPTFKDFAPVIKALNIGGEQFGFDTESNSQDMFDSPDRSYAKLTEQRQIAIEELQAELAKHDMAGTSGAAQKARIELLESIYGTSSKTAIENLKPEQIRDGIKQIKERFEVSEVVEDHEESEVQPEPEKEKTF